MRRIQFGDIRENHWPLISEEPTSWKTDNCHDQCDNTEQQMPSHRHRLNSEDIDDDARK